jgi:NADH:ubiquinone oxidoreductase subunit 2 (subunit N)
MNRKKRAGLWTAAFKLLSGSAVATAFGIRLGWKFAVITEVVVLLVIVIIWLFAAEDTDTGAIMGQRPNERQRLIALRASRLAHIVALCATIVAFVIAVAVNAVYWPFAALYWILVLSYVIGLRIYGVHEDAGAGEAAQEDARATS